MEPHLKISESPKYILLPGDPNRNDIINEQLTNVKEVKYNREFRISTGIYNGIEIGVVSSGIGCPSAAIAVEELANCGAKYIIRIGSCGGLLDQMNSGSIIIPEKSVGQDYYTYEVGESKFTKSNKLIFDNLISNCKKFGLKYYTGVNRTHDVFYESKEQFLQNEGKGFISSEMECSAVFGVSKKRDIKAGAVLVVNTVESFQSVRNDHNNIYKLDTSGDYKNSMKQAIKVALETFNNIHNGE